MESDAVSSADCMSVDVASEAPDCAAASEAGVAGGKEGTLRNLVRPAVGFTILMSIVFLTFGGWVQRVDVNVGILVTEFGLILGGSLLYALIMKQNPVTFFRWKPAKFSVFVKVFVMSFFMVPIAAALNSITVFFIMMFGTLRVPELPFAEDVSGLAWSLFLIAVSAGVCEEMMFRGALLSSFESRVGRKKAAWLAAILFGLFHFNFANLLSPIALGLVFAYVTQITDSIFPAIFGHFMNNGIAVMASFLVSQSEASARDISGTSDLPVSELSAAENLFGAGAMTAGQIAVIFAIALAVLVVCAFAVRTCLRSIKASYPQKMSVLYGEEVDSRYDYPVRDYPLWKKQPGSIGTLAAAGLILYAAVYAVLIFITFFC